MKKKILFVDLDAPEMRPLSRFRSVFSFRDGILTPLERIRLKYSDYELYLRHPNIFYESTMAEMEGMLPVPSQEGHTPHLFPSNENVDAAAVNVYAEVLRSDSLDLFRVLDRVSERIYQDIARLQLDREEYRYYDFEAQIVGPRTELYVHRQAVILPGSVFDTRKGPIVIDADAEITPFSYLAGPLYAGKNSRLDNVRLTGGCILGHEVRVGGEIENCIINDYSNKHHEGFLGHSILGSWVNLGALTTCSDLKNNYGEVRLKTPIPFIPKSGIANYNSSSADILNVSTGRIKFGCVVGDCVKVAIGTLLGTGTVIDCGSNVFGAVSPPKYVPPLSWGLTGERYAVERFLKDCERIFARRGRKPHPNLKMLAAHLVGRETSRPRE